MAEVKLTARPEQSAEPADPTTTPALTLAEEHVLLLGQVTARAEELLTAAAHGQWPAAELAALADYAQAELLRQVSDEETLLFPAAPSQEVTRLARGHARLRAAADMLAWAAAAEQPMSPGQLAVAVRDFAAQLERHMRTEENVLASGHPAQDVPGTAARGGHRHEWYPLTEGPAVDLDALPRSQAVAAAVDRLLRMRRGEQVELLSGADLDPVWREISGLCPGSYQFTVLQDGPTQWRMQVTRRKGS